MSATSLGFMKLKKGLGPKAACSFILLSAGCLSLLWSARAAVQLDDTKEASPKVAAQVMEDSDAPNAVVVTLVGKASYSADGVTFTDLTARDVFKLRAPSNRRTDPGETNVVFSVTEGTVVRTGDDSRVDLFFRRIGTTVRLQPNTELRLEKMTRRMENGEAVLETLLDLRKGRIFTVARSLVQGSKLEIRNAAGRSVVEGGAGKCRYIVTADGTHVTEKGSAVALKVVGGNGVTSIKPGMSYSAKDGKMLSLETPEAVKLLIEFDELDALAEQLANPAKP